jgi:tRNA-(ms[2]io[6]A)-hydroxylase
MLCLKRSTDAAWAVEASQDLDGILVDHAHCEMKAASNALSLATRTPSDIELVRTLTDLARDELDHFQRVLTLLAARGVSLGPPPVDDYAADLRRAAGGLARNRGENSLTDRLLVGAIIEARSCERFKLLAGATSHRDDARDLHALWSDLVAAEARHYRTFVELAVRTSGFDRTSTMARLDRLADIEASIVAALPSRVALAPRAMIHG